MKKKKQDNLIQKINLSRIIDFVKYHNAFTIGLALVFVFTGAIFASEDMHNTIIGETIITQAGIDNTAILAADLDNFDMEMTINGIFEDSLNYYINYSFKTIGVLDNVWQEIIKANRMTIAKASLGDKDLALYIAEELGEIVDYELVYLKQVQASEKEKGETRIVETEEYTGLTGLVLNIKDKVLPGYEPSSQLAQTQEQLFGEFTPQETQPLEQVAWLELEEQEPVNVPEIPAIDTTTESSSGVILPDIPAVNTTTSSNDGI